MKKWIEITDEYVDTISDLVKRKIRLQDGKEQWATWDEKEGCFFWAQGECAVYMDEPDARPTHILVG
jgi:hypothetical protein